MGNKILLVPIIVTMLSVAVIRAHANAPIPLRLPYADGQSFVVTQGYDSPPTHINKDEYANGDNGSSAAPSDPSNQSSVTPASPPFVLDAPSSANGVSSIVTYDANALNADFSWQAPANATGTITYTIFDMTVASSTTITSSTTPLWNGTSTTASLALAPDGTTRELTIQATDANGNTSIATTSLTLPDWQTVLQADTSTMSQPSWYSDTWYDLGTGFYGTIRSMTFIGGPAASPPFYSHLSLDEFLDANYTIKNQQFIISDDVPFDATVGLATISGLNIELQPNKYYRLNGYNDHQNWSVTLAGTSATGTAMFNGFVPGIGRVETQYSFYPYIAWTFIPNWPPLAPPDQPAVNFSFDQNAMALDLSWAAVHDADTTSSLLTYEYAMSTSTDLGTAMWQSVGHNLSVQIPVVYPNIYTVAVRARDDLGNVSTSTGVTWMFPSGYVPFPEQLDHSVQGVSPTKFHLYATTTITSVDLWTQFPGSNIYRAGYDTIEIHADANGSPGDLLELSDLVNAGGWGFEVSHDLPQPLTLSPGDYWLVQGPQQAAGSLYFGDAAGEMYFRLQTE